MHAARKIFILAALAAFASAAQIPNGQFDEAERRIVRLPPAAFPQLPGGVKRELRRRGCTIPQEADT